MRNKLKLKVLKLARMFKDDAKLKIQELVEKYEKVKSSRSISKYTEEETKKDFIQPLFQALDWNTTDKNEVTAEQVLSAGRIDYGFYLDGRLKFNVEAKSLKTDLNREDYANQAVKYSWNKGATWAILTDFENLKVFNAQVIDRSLADKLFFDIPYSQYIERFDQLWLLSKEAFTENLLDKEAEKVGKKLQKVSVSALLYKDLNACRDILTHVLSMCNPKVDKDLLDEGVQKLLDRLIFLRVAEDRGIEGPILKELLREHEEKGGHKFQSMVKKFRELDTVYNSNLFSEHPFEKWEEYGDATERVIKILYGKPGYYEYDFKAMPADVLGGVYENYLGYRLEKSRKGLSVSKDAKKRKEHGIYYTPDFIVEYIVKNTLKPVLDKCTSIGQLKKIKVLDPACGSGSFLIKALEAIYEKYQEFNVSDGFFTKIQILQENIYGVDLDPQAVEIARLNLLINALDTRMKLPGLEKNIKNGNSLIYGTDEELKKYFSKNFRDRKSFNWKEEFPEVFKQGGFDVIVGNPPYIQLSEDPNLEIGLKDYLINTYGSSMGRLNTFGFFIKLGLNLLKESGYLGFIIPNTILTQDYYEPLRMDILKFSALKTILSFEDLPFKDAVVENVVLTLEKKVKGHKQNDVNINKVNSDFTISLNCVTGQTKFEESFKHSFNIKNDDAAVAIRKKMETDSLPLSYFVNINQAIALRENREKWISKEKLNNDYKPLLVGGRNITRYSFFWDGTFLKYDKDGIHSGGDEKKFIQKEKIVFRRVANHFIGTLDTKQFYALHTIVVMTSKEKSVDMKFLLALFNSKLLNFYYHVVFASTKKVFAEIGARQVAELPIKTGSKIISQKISQLVDKILQLNEDIKKQTENSDKWNLLKSEIEKTDKKIDDEVYKLYGLTPKEIENVESKI